jgi:hypothetical protein
VEGTFPTVDRSQADVNLEFRRANDSAGGKLRHLSHDYSPGTKNWRRLNERQKQRLRHHEIDIRSHHCARIVLLVCLCTTERSSCDLGAAAPVGPCAVSAPPARPTPQATLPRPRQTNAPRRSAGDRALTSQRRKRLFPSPWPTYPIISLSPVSENRGTGARLFPPKSSIGTARRAGRYIVPLRRTTVRPSQKPNWRPHD